MWAQLKGRFNEMVDLRCDHKMMKGVCRAHFVKFGYDRKTGQC